MIKLIATDIDGTLLNADGKLPDGFGELLLRLDGYATN
jgi:hydroxymethylpyrimidine pyrophosphatase-like HAD family hydrolase